MQYVSLPPKYLGLLLPLKLILDRLEIQWGQSLTEVNGRLTRTEAEVRERQTDIR